MQPEIYLNDYSEKSVVLRSNPSDFFKAYSNSLIELGGKWSPYLKENPSNPNSGILGGWIFPKTRENNLRQGLQAILSGQVQEYKKKAQKDNNTSIIESSVLQQAISFAQANTLSEQQTVNPEVPIGYQKVSYVVIKPEVGMMLYLIIKLNEKKQKVSLVVSSVETTTQGVTNKAVVTLDNGQQTMIELVNNKWQVPKYDVLHTITL